MVGQPDDSARVESQMELFRDRLREFPSILFSSFAMMRGPHRRLSVAVFFPVGIIAYASVNSHIRFVFVVNCKDSSAAPTREAESTRDTDKFYEELGGTIGRPRTTLA